MSSANELIEERKRQVIEDRVAMAIANLFVRHPDLVGFHLQDPSGFKDVLNPPGRNDLSVIDVALMSAPTATKAHEDMTQYIRDTVTRILSERPEAFEMIRDRTFARVFH